MSTRARERAESDARMRKMAIAAGPEALMALYGVEPRTPASPSPMKIEIELRMKLVSLPFRLLHAIERSGADAASSSNVEADKDWGIGIKRFVSDRSPCGELDEAKLRTLVMWCREGIERRLTRYDSDLISDMLFCHQAFERGYTR